MSAKKCLMDNSPWNKYPLVLVYYKGPKGRDHDES